MKVELKKDLFHIAYNAKRLTPETMLKAIQSTGFRGKIVQATEPDASNAKRVGRNVNNLPKEIRSVFVQAKKSGRNVLLTFHGPG